MIINVQANFFYQQVIRMHLQGFCCYFLVFRCSSLFFAKVTSSESLAESGTKAGLSQKVSHKQSQTQNETELVGRLGTVFHLFPIMIMTPSLSIDRKPYCCRWLLHAEG